MLKKERETMLIGATIALRPTTRDDAELMTAWYNDPEFLGEHFNHWPRTVDMIRDRVEQNRGAEKAQYLIVRRSDNEPLGMAGFLNPYAAEHAAMFHGIEIYYQVHQNYRRQGVATQAACLLVNHLFSARPIERIVGYVAEHNLPSRKVLEAAGLQYEGLHRHMNFNRGAYVNVAQLGMIRSDWVSEAEYRNCRVF
jgi:RimJ/RimL family protein N-acetyltransferase